MKRCGLYARVSTDDQASVKGGSLDTQLDLLGQQIRLKNGTGEEDWKAVATYREEGKSGKNTDRPEFQRMLRDVESGKIDTVLCTKIDRISRSLPDFYEFLATVELHGSAFVSLSEQLDTSTAQGRAFGKIILVLAELEREQTSERTTEKMAWRAQKGLRNGGQILGYDVDPENKGVPASGGRPRGASGATQAPDQPLQDHKGTIEVESKVGQGTTITTILPYNLSGFMLR